MTYKYYIGLDAHKENCFFVVLNSKGKIMRRQKLKTNESNLVEFLTALKGSRSLVFEETALSQWLYTILKDKVENLVVCLAPAKSAKSDFRDAAEMAELHRVNGLKSVYHGETKYMLLRDLVHGYDSLVKDLTRQKNRLSHLFNRTAIKRNKLKIYTDRATIEQLPGNHRQFVANRLFDQIQQLASQKKEFHAVFMDNIKHYKEMKLIMGIPGFGIVRTNQVVAHVITPTRFANKGNFFSYAMLTRHSQLSDGKVYSKKNSHAKSQLKDVFKSATLTALNSNNAFRRKYDEMLLRNLDERSARNSIAKSLAATVLGVWKSGKPFSDKHWEAKRGKYLADKK